MSKFSDIYITNLDAVPTGVGAVTSIQLAYPIRDAVEIEATEMRIDTSGERVVKPGSDALTIDRVYEALEEVSTRYDTDVQAFDPVVIKIPPGLFVGIEGVNDSRQMLERILYAHRTELQGLLSVRLVEYQNRFYLEHENPTVQYILVIAKQGSLTSTRYPSFKGRTTDLSTEAVEFSSITHTDSVELRFTLLSHAYDTEYDIDAGLNRSQFLEKMTIMAEGWPWGGRLEWRYSEDGSRFYVVNIPRAAQPDLLSLDVRPNNLVAPINFTLEFVVRPPADPTADPPVLAKSGISVALNAALNTGFTLDDADQTKTVFSRYKECLFGSALNTAFLTQKETIRLRYRPIVASAFGLKIAQPSIVQYPYLVWPASQAPNKTRVSTFVSVLNTFYLIDFFRPFHIAPIASYTTNSDESVFFLVLSLRTGVTENAWIEFELDLTNLSTDAALVLGVRSLKDAGQTTLRSVNGEMRFPGAMRTSIDSVNQPLKFSIVERVTKRMNPVYVHTQTTETFISNLGNFLKTEVDSSLEVKLDPYSKKLTLASRTSSNINTQFELVLSSPYTNLPRRMIGFPEKLTREILPFGSVATTNPEVRIQKIVTSPNVPVMRTMDYVFVRFNPYDTTLNATQALNTTSSRVGFAAHFAFPIDGSTNRDAMILTTTGESRRFLIDFSGKTCSVGTFAVVLLDRDNNVLQDTAFEMVLRCFRGGRV